MIQPDSSIYLLIAKYSQGNISEEEYHILKAWMEEHADNKKIFSEYLIFLKNAQRVRFAAKVDEHLAWKVIQSNLEKRKTFGLRPYIKYAAVLLVVVSLAISYQLLNKPADNNNMFSEVQVITPGKPKATLELSDGRSINLEGMKDSSLLLGNGFNIQIKNETIDYSKAGVNSELVNTIRIPKGGEYNLVLSDGTRIWLNSDSELSFPAKFSGEKREISLKGEAYLEVAKNENFPFVVDVKGVQIEVLGTSFNIKAYDNVATTLVEGKVNIRTNASTYVILRPGDQGIVNSDDNSVDVKQVDVRLFTSWVNGMFTFKSMPLEEIMKNFERWYDVSVSYEDENLKQRHFTGNLRRYEEITPHLNLIGLTTDLDFKISGNTILVVKK